MDNWESNPSSVFPKYCEKIKKKHIVYLFSDQARIVSVCCYDFFWVNDIFS